MTSNQINTIKNILDYNSEKSRNSMGYAPLLNNHSIIVTKEDMLFSDINHWRYKFVDSKEILERAQVRLYSYSVTDVPSHGHYDVYSNGSQPTIVYEYLTDSNGHMLTDYYTYDSIIMFVPNASCVKTSEII